MVDEDHTLDKEWILELQRYVDAYQDLSAEEKESLNIFIEGKPTSAQRLSELLKYLNPEQTTHGQVRELAKLYYATRNIPVAYKVLSGFDAAKLNYCITQSLTTLPSNVMARVHEYLGGEKEKDEKGHSTDSQSRVQLASKVFFLDDSRKNRLGQALLRHVIKGNQDTVVLMLKRYPDLLLHRGHVVDYSGREFKDVTAFELAIWALDVRHMASAMLKCLTENEDGKDYRKELAPELQSQFDNVLNTGSGVHYTIGCGLLKMSQDPSIAPPNETPVQKGERLNELSRLFNRHNGLIQYHDRLFYFHNHHCPKELVEITDSNAIQALQEMMNKKGRNLKEGTLQITHFEDELETIQKNVPHAQHIFKENHYDFGFLIRALDGYVQHYVPENGLDPDWDGLNTYSCTVVGLAQHFIPAHVAHHYCNPDESFDPTGTNTPPTFKEKTLKRRLGFDNYATQKDGAWWSSVPNSSSSRQLQSLDLAYGVVRGAECQAWSLVHCLELIWSKVPRCDVQIDLGAVASLYEVRKSELNELRNMLVALEKPDAEVILAHHEYAN